MYLIKAGLKYLEYKFPPTRGTEYTLTIKCYTIEDIQKAMKKILDPANEWTFKSLEYVKIGE